MNLCDNTISQVFCYLQPPILYGLRGLPKLLPDQAQTGGDQKATHPFPDTQRKSAAYTRQGSLVQSLSRPPIL